MSLNEVWEQLGGGIANSFEICKNEYSCEVHIFFSYGLAHILDFPEKLITHHILEELLENIMTYLTLVWLPPYLSIFLSKQRFHLF